MIDQIYNGKKLRYSKQREKIFQFIQESDEKNQHPSTDTIYSSLKDEIAGLSLGTVYRNLKILEGTGMIRSVGLVDGVYRYELNDDNHGHFLCEKCKKLYDLDQVDFKKIEQALALQHNFDINDVEIRIKGICPDCKD